MFSDFFVNISYKINDQYLLRSVNLLLEPGKVLLITGIENNNLNILGGIIGKIFPIQANINIPEINSLIKNFTGTVEITNGSLPEKVAYLSTDPERHFLFATVKEELAITLPTINHIKLLQSFGLAQNLYERNLASLSGGEKMKVALAMVFAQYYDCYVLHNVIPWLDQAGRKFLVQHLNYRSNNNSCIVLIEHEITNLTAIADDILWFTGQTVVPYSQQDHYVITKPILKPTTTRLLEFTNVTLIKHPPTSQPILNTISFQLNTNSIYALIGDNGAGKSTLAQMLFRIITPTTGIIKFLEYPLLHYSRAELNELICYIGQFPSQQIIFSTLGQYQEQLQKEKKLLAQKIFMQYLQLPPDTPITTLTLLQMKLLLLANGSTNKTKLIILDEPTWGIDKIGQQLFWQVLQELQQQLGATVLLISHNKDLISNLTTQIMYFNNGKLYF